jgi:SAM-dependent methyltransferase
MTGQQPVPSGTAHRIGRHLVDEDWPVTGETSRSFKKKLRNGFYATYMGGDVILDVGYRGGAAANAVAVLPHAIGIDLDYPGYDGSVLPFADASVDTVFSSHMLEHVVDYVATIRDWFRVLRPGGFLVCIVPHQFLYEKRWRLPSQWNLDHQRFYTPAGLLHEFEEALEPNTYRVRHLRDNDDGYNYAIGPERHADGAYEIELVIEKLQPPRWGLAGEPQPERAAAATADWFDAAIAAPVEEILRRRRQRPSPLRAALNRIARRLAPGHSPLACAEEARHLGRWARAARFYADALIAEPAARSLWSNLAEMLERAGRAEEAALARRWAAQL